MWNLTDQSEQKRTYVNQLTNGKLTMTMIYTDQEKNSWWVFDDLANLPLTRTFASMKITSLYTLGLTGDDLKDFVQKMKVLLKSNDAEKYEKAFGEVLAFEDKTQRAIDPVGQLSALITVYFTINDELIDSFENDMQLKKMALIAADPAMHNFFLNLEISRIEDYRTTYAAITQIVSTLSSESLGHLAEKSNGQQTINE